MNVGERIQQLRRKNGLSQEELGKLLFVSRQTISLWEKGQTLPTVDNLLRLKEIFGVSVDEILSGEEHKAPSHTAAQRENECTGCGFFFNGDYCPKCGKPTKSDKRECTECGFFFVGDFCPKCGKPVALPDGMVRCDCGSLFSGNFCPKCGTPAVKEVRTVTPTEDAKAPSEKKKPTAPEGSIRCRCGAIYTGDFCPKCGKSKPDINKRNRLLNVIFSILSCAGALLALVSVFFIGITVEGNLGEYDGKLDSCFFDYFFRQYEIINLVERRFGLELNTVTDRYRLIEAIFGTLVCTLTLVGTALFTVLTIVKTVRYNTKHKGTSPYKSAFSAVLCYLLGVGAMQSTHSFSIQRVLPFSLDGGSTLLHVPHATSRLNDVTLVLLFVLLGVLALMLVGTVIAKRRTLFSRDNALLSVFSLLKIALVIAAAFLYSGGVTKSLTDVEMRGDMLSYALIASVFYVHTGVSGLNGIEYDWSLNQIHTVGTISAGITLTCFILSFFALTRAYNAIERQQKPSRAVTWLDGSLAAFTLVFAVVSVIGAAFVSGFFTVLSDGGYLQSGATLVYTPFAAAMLTVACLTLSVTVICYYTRLTARANAENGSLDTVSSRPTVYESRTQRIMDRISVSLALLASVIAFVFVFFIGAVKRTGTIAEAESISIFHFFGANVITLPVATDSYASVALHATAAIETLTALSTLLSVIVMTFVCMASAAKAFLGTGSSGIRLPLCAALCYVVGVSLFGYLHTYSVQYPLSTTEVELNAATVVGLVLVGYLAFSAVLVKAVTFSRMHLGFNLFTVIKCALFTLAYALIPRCIHGSYKSSLSASYDITFSASPFCFGEYAMLNNRLSSTGRWETVSTLAVSVTSALIVIALGILVIVSVASSAEKLQSTNEKRLKSIAMDIAVFVFCLLMPLCSWSASDRLSDFLRVSSGYGMLSWFSPATAILGLIAFIQAITGRTLLPSYDKQ